MSALSANGTPWDQKQSQILAGAEQVFIEAGFEGASVNLIAQRAGVSKATLYNHFPNKEELFTACIQRRIKHIAQALSESFVTSKGTIEHDLADIGQHFLALTMDPQVIAFFRVVIAEALRQPSLAQLLYKQGAKAIQEQLAQNITKWVEMGELEIEDPILAAQQFFSLCKCEAESRMLFCMSDQYSAVELQNFVHRAVRTFLRAYGQH